MTGWREELHPRHPAGSPGATGGEFAFRSGPAAGLERLRDKRPERQRALDAIEDDIRDDLVETGVVVDSNGFRLAVEVGDEDSVEFTDREIALMRNMTLTHNHPSETTSDWPYANGLSKQDVLLAIRAELRAIRAVGTGADYELRIDWGDRMGVFEKNDLANKIRDAYYEADGLVQAKWYRWLGSKAPPGSQQFEDLAEIASREHWHDVWSYVDEKMPEVDYRRTLRTARARRAAADVASVPLRAPGPPPVRAPLTAELAEIDRLVRAEVEGR